MLKHLRKFVLRKKIWGAGRTQKAHFRPQEIRKSMIFGRNSVFSHPEEGPEPRNEVGNMKTFLEAHLQFLARVEKFSTTPHPEGTFSGTPKFRPKSIFGRKSGFLPFCEPGVSKRVFF